MATVTRRRALAALAPLLGAGAGSRLLSGEAAAQHQQVSDGHDTSGHVNGHLEHAGLRRGGRVDHARNGFDPTAMVRDFDEGTTTRLASGRILREWELIALRDAAGRVLDRAVAGGIAGGMLVLYATGLVVSA